MTQMRAAPFEPAAGRPPSTKYSAVPGRSPAPGSASRAPARPEEQPRTEGGRPTVFGDELRLGESIAGTPWIDLDPRSASVWALPAPDPASSSHPGPPVEGLAHPFPGSRRTVGSRSSSRWHDPAIRLEYRSDTGVPRPLPRAGWTARTSPAMTCFVPRRRMCTSHAAPSTIRPVPETVASRAAPSTASRPRPGRAPAATRFPAPAPANTPTAPAAARRWTCSIEDP